MKIKRNLKTTTIKREKLMKMARSLIPGVAAFWGNLKVIFFFRQRTFEGFISDFVSSVW
jgi:hypothetical protein